MKLFIFEPYEWSYCGGVIGIISDTFENAVNFIVEKDRKRAIEDKTTGKVAYREYRKKYFAASSNKFKKDNWDQWLLTHTFEVPEETETRIAFDNWNYG